MIDLSKIPDNAVGLRLCKIKSEKLILCEPVFFKNGREAVNTTLRRASLAGSIGPIGETGNFWADFIDTDGLWMETIALSSLAWKILKNHWMRCKIQRLSYGQGGKND